MFNLLNRKNILLVSRDVGVDKMHDTRKGLTNSDQYQQLQINQIRCLDDNYLTSVLLNGKVIRFVDLLHVVFESLVFSSMESADKMIKNSYHIFYHISFIKMKINLYYYLPINWCTYRVTIVIRRVLRTKQRCETCLSHWICSSIINHDPRRFHDVIIYMSNPWVAAADVTVRNLNIHCECVMKFQFPWLGLYSFEGSCKIIVFEQCSHENLFDWIISCFAGDK